MVRDSIEKTRVPQRRHSDGADHEEINCRKDLSQALADARDMESEAELLSDPPAPAPPAQAEPAEVHQPNLLDRFESVLDDKLDSKIALLGREVA